METKKQLDPEVGDDNKSEEEATTERETPMDEAPKVKLLRLVLSSSSKPKPKLSTYDGNLVAENLMDWISELDKYFEYKEIEEDKWVKFVVTRLKFHVALWWDNVQAERRKKGIPLIKSWDKMIAKMKGKFLPKDYQLSLYKQVHNLK